MQHDEIEGRSFILSLFRYMNPPDKRLGNPRNRKVRDFRHYANIYDKMLCYKLLPLICFRYGFQQCKRLHYRLMPFQNRVIVKT